MALRVKTIGGDVVEDPETGDAIRLPIDREELATVVEDYVGALLQNGGMLALTVEREVVGEHGGQPIVESSRVIVHYDAYSPARDLREAQGGDESGEPDGPQNRNGADLAPAEGEDELDEAPAA